MDLVFIAIVQRFNVSKKVMVTECNLPTFLLNPMSPSIRKETIFYIAVYYISLFFVLLI